MARSCLQFSISHDRLMSRVMRPIFGGLLCKRDLAILCAIVATSGG